MNTYELQGIYETILSCRKKRGVPATPFEEHKPIIEALLNGKSLYSLSKEMEVNYRTLHKRSQEALKYIDPENTTRILTSEQELWLQDQLRLAKKLKRL